MTLKQAIDNWITHGLKMLKCNFCDFHLTKSAIPFWCFVKCLHKKQKKNVWLFELLTDSSRAKRIYFISCITEECLNTGWEAFSATCLKSLQTCCIPYWYFELKLAQEQALILRSKVVKCLCLSFSKIVCPSIFISPFECKQIRFVLSDYRNNL